MCVSLFAAALSEWWCQSGLTLVKRCCFSWRLAFRGLEVAPIPGETGYLAIADEIVTHACQARRKLWLESLSTAFPLHSRSSRNRAYFPASHERLSGFD